MKCEHEQDDGAYVLGALSPAERASYERHLSTCSFCREAVADIAVLPGLLGRLDPADFAKLLEPTPPPAVPLQRSRLPELVSAVETSRRQERRSGRWRATGASLIAACLALVVGGAVALAWRGSITPAPLSMVAMHPVAEAVPVEAKVNLTDTPFGTRVTMECAYDKTDSSPKQYNLRLMAYGPDDESEQISSWLAVPGTSIDVVGITHFTGAELARVALVRYDEKVLLSYEVP
jgi:hypothetical protein